jgi:glycosyltransferase 2 family protein
VRNALRLTFGIAVSLGCLYFATRGTDWSQVGGVLAEASIGWTLAVALGGVAAVYIRAQRWRILLRPLGRVPLYPALSATAIGFGASAVLPFRVGELLRPALLSRHTGIRMTAALSSVMLERLCDVALVVSWLLILSLIYPIPVGLRRLAWIVAAGVAVGFVVLVAMERRRAGAERLLDFVFAPLPARLGRALRPFVLSFLDGIAGLNDRRTVVLVLGYSIYLWSMIALTFLFGLLALDVQVPSILATSLATVVTVAAFVFLPQAPGFVGTWQAGCVLALGLFGVPREIAVGYSVLTWIAQMVVNVGTAGVFLAREDFSLDQMRRMATEEAPAAQAEAE